MTDLTWRDVIDAATLVANSHHKEAATWFREAGIRGKVANHSLWDTPYDGKPISNWPLSIRFRTEIIDKLDEKKKPKPPETEKSRPKGELVRLDVPYISQYDKEADEQGADCGPTCVAMIIRAKPAPPGMVTVDDLYKRYLPEDHQGNTFWGDLSKMGKGEGLSPGFKKNSKRSEALQDVKTLILAGHPTIVLVNYGNWPFVTENRFDGFHFVLVTGFDENNIYVHDPIFGAFSKRSKGQYCRLANDTFLNGWGFTQPGNVPLERMAVTNKQVPFRSD